MAKLNQFAKNAGYNAGDNYAVKLARVEDIVIDPELEGIFKIHDEIRDKIAEQIKTLKFDKSQPLPLQKGTNILLDGHTRLAAAKQAGLTEVPVVELEIEERKDMLLYTYKRQALRRNLTSPEIIQAVKFMEELAPVGRNKKGLGRRGDEFAKEIGTSPATVYQAKAILRDGTGEDLQAVLNGEASIKTMAKKIADPKKERKPKNTAINNFLLRAVTILVEHDEDPAAEILINEYLPIQQEREDFAKLLPKAVQNRLTNW